MFNFTKKGQAAMDLLLTYGWVLVVIIGIIAVLAGSGIFDTDQFAGSSCRLNDAGLTCESTFSIVSGTTGSVSLTLLNSNPESITLTGLSLQYEGGTSETCDRVVDGTAASLGDGAQNENVTLSSGEQQGIKFTGCALTDGTHVVTTEKQTYDITITTEVNGIEVPASGVLRGTAS